MKLSQNEQKEFLLWCQKEKSKSERGLVDFFQLEKEVYETSRKITDDEWADIISKCWKDRPPTREEIDTCFPLENRWPIEPIIVRQLTSYYKRRIKKLERTLNDFNLSNLEKVKIEDLSDEDLEELETFSNFLEEINQEIQLRKEKIRLILKLSIIDKFNNNQIFTINEKILEQFNASYDTIEWNKMYFLLFGFRRYHSLFKNQIKAGRENVIKKNLISVSSKKLIEWKNGCRGAIDLAKDRIFSSILDILQGQKEQAGWEQYLDGETFSNLFPDTEASEEKQEQSKEETKSKTEEPTDEGYESSEEKEEPSNQPTTNPTAEQTQESNKNQPVTTETPTIPPKNKEQPDQKVSDNPPQENKTPNKPDLWRYELIQASKTKITSLLVKYHINLKNLGQEFQNWEKKLDTLTRQLEIEQFVKLMEQAIVRQSQSQVVSKAKPKSESFPLWFWLVNGVIIVGVGLVVLMRWVWWRKKKVNKQ